MSDYNDSTKYWWIKGNQIGIGYYGTNSDGNTALMPVEEAKEVSIVYDGDFPELSDLTDTPALPTKFHSALTEKAIQLGYEEDRNKDMLGVAQYWNNKFDMTLKRIQEFKNKAYTKAVNIVKTNHPWAIK